MYYHVASRVYDIYAPIYDRVGFIFRKGLARALAAVPFREGDRVLDVGVGTGLSLEYYPAYVHVTGVDQSEAMLAQARKKVFRRQVRINAPVAHTRLIQGDALCLPFPNESFDVVVLSHVIGTVSNPNHCLSEAVRVGTDRAYIVLHNHFESPGMVLGILEELLDPICRHLGWRTSVSLEPLLRRFKLQNMETAAEAQKEYVSTIYLQKCASGLRMLPIPLLTTDKMSTNVAGQALPA